MIFKKQQGKLQLLLISKRAWDVFYMDFVTDLRKNVVYKSIYTLQYFDCKQTFINMSTTSRMVFWTPLLLLANSFSTAKSFSFRLFTKMTLSI